MCVTCACPDPLFPTLAPLLGPPAPTLGRFPCVPKGRVGGVEGWMSPRHQQKHYKMRSACRLSPPVTDRDACWPERGRPAASPCGFAQGRSVLLQPVGTPVAHLLLPRRPEAAPTDSPFISLVAARRARLAPQCGPTRISKHACVGRRRASFIHYSPPHGSAGPHPGRHGPAGAASGRREKLPFPAQCSGPAQDRRKFVRLIQARVTAA
jgi:hypothetical protein